MRLPSFLQRLIDRVFGRRKPPAPPAPPVPPPPVEPPPPPSPPFLYGFWFEDALRYGDFSEEVRGVTNLYVAENRVGYQAVDDEPAGLYWPILRERLKRECGPGTSRSLFFNLRTNDPAILLPKSINTIAPYAERLKLLSLADEPEWDLKQTNRKAQEVRDLMQGAGFVAPLGVVLNEDLLLREEIAFSSELDWVGVETYLREVPGESVDEVISRLRGVSSFLFSKVPAGKKILVAGQGFSRNFQWDNIETLAALQWATYQIARELGDRCAGLMFFAYGRPSGIRTYPELQTAHKAIWADILKRA